MSESLSVAIKSQGESPTIRNGLPCTSKRSREPDAVCSGKRPLAAMIDTVTDWGVLVPPVPVQPIVKVVLLALRDGVVKVPLAA